MPPLSKKESALLGQMQERMVFIREKRIILSTHLAGLYGIEPRILVQAIKRNKACFPDQSFVFQLSAVEFSALKSQFVISEYNQIRRSRPYALTEQGIVMLAGVLQGTRAAAAMNIAIVRIFTRPHRSYLRVRLPAPG
ncbi:MAG TPA: ORF6N domain-containing protein [Candidatus Paceibacterota bacterium]|nr:ORF6N domain-containing protein [Candidatus Paceibacterota bacterium]